MTNNDKIIISIGFVWDNVHDAMGVWVPCEKGINPFTQARDYRKKWKFHTGFRSRAEIIAFRDSIQFSTDQEKINVERGLESLTKYIKLNPEKFSQALQE